MIRTQIQLTEEQYKYLREKAAENKVSMAALIRQGVELLVSQDTKPDHTELVRRAKALAGKYKDIYGAMDVARNHDKYLAEIYAEVCDGNEDLD
jgi:hypothetical protein